MSELENSSAEGRIRRSLGEGGQLPTPNTSSLCRWLETAATVLIAMQIVLRIITGGESTSDGVNVFIHLLIWIAALLWLLSQAMRPTWTIRLTGLELFMIGFILLSIVSFLLAPYQFPALLQCFAFTSFFLLFFLIVQNFSRETPSMLITLLCGVVLTVSLYGILQRLFLLDEIRGISPSEAGISQESLDEWKWRLSGNEIFGTFHSANTLAGFFVLMIPLMLGLAMDRWKALKSPRAFGSAMMTWILLGCTGLAMIWTGSSGGWTALLAGITVIAAFYQSQRLERWKPWFRLGGLTLAFGAVLIVLVTAFWKGGPTHRSESMAVRGTYWSAASGMIAEHPWFGVGLRNFGDEYTAHKPEDPEESRHAHNDYLQLWAEMGIFGFLLFGLIWSQLLRKFFLFSSTSSPSPPLESSPPAHWPWLIGGVLAFVLGYVMDRTFDSPPFLWLVFLALFGISFWANIGGIMAQWSHDRRFTTLGLAAGVVGFLVHLLVDYDFYVAGTGETFLVVSALLVAALSRSALTEVRIPSRAAWIGIAIVLFVTVPTLTSFLPGLLESDTMVQTAREHLKEKKWDEAEKNYNAAMQQNPLDAELHAEIAGFYFQWYLEAGAKGPSGRAETLLEVCLSASNNMLRLRPHNASFHHLAARWSWEAYRLNLRKNLRPGSMEYAKTVGQRQTALQRMHEAVTLYPTDVRYRYDYGAMLEESGDAAGAIAQYREALRLHQAYQARQNSTKRAISKRFLLVPEAEKRAREKVTGKP